MSEQTELARRLKLAMATANEGVLLELCAASAALLERTCEGCVMHRIGYCNLHDRNVEKLGHICGRWTPKEGA